MNARLTSPDGLDVGHGDYLNFVTDRGCLRCGRYPLVIRRWSAPH